MPRLLSVALAACILLPLTACNMTQGPVRETDISGRDTDDPYADLSPTDRVELAVLLLEEGKPDEARVQLDRALAQEPARSWTARRLLQQLDEDPEVLLGRDSFRYDLKRGESLSLLADRYLGDGLLFYALARYNGITVPGRVSAGRTLKIPTQRTDEPENPPAAEPLSAQSSAEDPSQNAPSITATAESMTGRIHLTKAEKLAEGGDVGGARKHLGLARGFAESNGRLYADINAMETDLDRREAGFLLHQANAALATGDTARAHRLLSRSVELDPARGDAKARLAATTTRLVAEYHRNALGQLRVGHECSAMDFWRKILLMDPGNAVAESQQQRVQERLDSRRQRCVNI